MINLLPTERKQDIRAARTNVILIRYNLITVGAIAILGAFCLVFYILLQNNQVKALSTADENSQKAASLSGVRVAALNYSNDLSFAKQIIGNSLSYTDVVIAVTKLMPDGAILDALKIKSSDFSQRSQFQAHASSYAVAEQLKQNFQTSKLFKNVFFDSLVQKSDAGTDKLSSTYPVSVSINAQFDAAGVKSEK